MPGRSLRAGVGWRRRVREDEEGKVAEDEADEEEGRENERGLRFVTVVDGRRYSCSSVV